MDYEKLKARDRVIRQEIKEKALAAHKRAKKKAKQGKGKIFWRGDRIVLWQNRLPYKKWKQRELDRAKAQFSGRVKKLKPKE